jgi:hypothetical protein
LRNAYASLIALSVFNCCALVVIAQTTSYRSETVAGVLPDGNGGPATSAILDHPDAVAFGPDGTVYVSEARAIRKITADGQITQVCAMPPWNMAVSPYGTIYTALALEL